MQLCVCVSLQLCAGITASSFRLLLCQRMVRSYSELKIQRQLQATAADTARRNVSLSCAFFENLLQNCSLSFMQKAMYLKDLFF